MIKDKYKSISKLMSLALRHDPSVLDLHIEAQGWVSTVDLINGLNRKGKEVDLQVIKKIVEENDKQRFGFSDDFKKIRANQGHSIEVTLDLPSTEPPIVLYHGTTVKYMESIRKSGLQSMNRQHVHLSHEVQTAENVGSRHGKPVILKVQSLAMYKDGFEFYLSKNGVWLTDHVPVKYIDQ